jgi:hypothetical protein
MNFTVIPMQENREKIPIQKPNTQCAIEPSQISCSTSNPNKSDDFSYWNSCNLKFVSYDQYVNSIKHYYY